MPPLFCSTRAVAPGFVDVEVPPVEVEPVEPVEDDPVEPVDVEAEPVEALELVPEAISNASTQTHRPDDDAFFCPTTLMVIV